jgi:DNA-directed RNA polymerase subunit A"
MEIPKKIMDDFEKYCKDKGYTGKKKDEMKERLLQLIDKSRYEPGEAIGVIAAQSISEPATQMTMRSYTLATMVGGITKVVQGLPRMIEIFDLRKTFNKSMTIYLKEKYNTKPHAEKVAEEIRTKMLKDVLRSHSIDILNMQLEFEFDREGEATAMKEVLGKFGEVSKREKKMIIKPKKMDLKALRKLKDKMLYIRVGGVDGIENLVVVKEREDWVLKTTGSNLKSVLEDDRVDEVRTTTDDIEQIYEVLGIEAARNCILREAKQTLSEQGLDVDMRHLMLVSDIMCVDGKPKPIGRYGVAGEKPSVLAKANFEETKKHLSNAAYFGKVDKLVGVVENVMVGQIVPVGTGATELTIDLQKMRTGKPKKEKKEDKEE